MTGKGVNERKVNAEPRRCARCGRPLPERSGPGRPRVYCSKRCRRAAAEEKRQAGETGGAGRGFRMVEWTEDDLAALEAAGPTEDDLAALQFSDEEFAAWAAAAWAAVWEALGDLDG